MKILKSMAYTAVAAVAAYNVYLAADIQQVKSDLTFDTIELTASGAEPGGDNSRIIDDSCSPGSPAWYAKMYGDSYGQSGGPGRDPYCENALYGHDAMNKYYGTLPMNTNNTSNNTSNNSSKSNVELRYQYYNGKAVPQGPLNTNWKDYLVRVTCSTTIGPCSDSYEQDMIKCGYGDGDCWISQICLIVD